VATTLRLSSFSRLAYQEPQASLFKESKKKTHMNVILLVRNELYPHAYCDNSSLVAFGSLKEIVICQMRPKIKEIYQIPKPNFCKERAIPYIDWGYGLTPKHRERTVPILAIAWDGLI